MRRMFIRMDKKNNKCPMCRKLIIDNLVYEINNEKKNN